MALKQHSTDDEEAGKQAATPRCENSTAAASPAAPSGHSAASCTVRCTVSAAVVAASALATLALLLAACSCSYERCSAPAALSGWARRSGLGPARDAVLDSRCCAFGTWSIGSGVPRWAPAAAPGCSPAAETASWSPHDAFSPDLKACLAGKHIVMIGDR